MNLSTPLLLGSLIAFAAAGVCHQAGAQAPSTPQTDVVTLATGAIVPCRIVEATPEMLRIEYRPAGAVGTLSRDVPWADISSADFMMDAEFHALLKSTDIAKDGAAFASRWAAVQPLLGRPNHPGGELGLAYASAFLASPEPRIRERALEVCKTVEALDWNQPRRDRARVLHMEALAALGRLPEARSEAEKLLAESGLDEAVAVRAQLFLASLNFQELRKLQEENPRWEDDDVVLPDRARLFHEAVEHNLRPSLFASSLESAAAEGLWRAAEVYLFDKDVPAAADCARDILHLYPAQPQAAQAKELLARHKLSPEPALPEPEMPGEEMKKEEPAPEPPPEPEVTRRKRYAKPDEKKPAGATMP